MTHRHYHLPVNWENPFEKTFRQAEFRLFLQDFWTAQKFLDENYKELQYYKTDCEICSPRIKNIQNAIDDIQERIKK